MVEEENTGQEQSREVSGGTKNVSDRFLHSSFLGPLQNYLPNQQSLHFVSLQAITYIHFLFSFIFGIVSWTLTFSASHLEKV